MQIVIDKLESPYIFLQMKINCLYGNQPASGVAEHSRVYFSFSASPTLWQEGPDFVWPLIHSRATFKQTVN